jgi:hypothetical protein
VHEMAFVDRLTLRIMQGLRPAAALALSLAAGTGSFILLDMLIRTRLYWRLDLPALTHARVSGTGAGRQEVALVFAAVLAGMMTALPLQGSRFSARHTAWIACVVVTILAFAYWRLVSGAPSLHVVLLAVGVPVAYWVARRTER